MNSKFHGRDLVRELAGDGAEGEGMDEKSLYRIEQHSQWNNQDAATCGHFAPFNPSSPKSALTEHGTSGIRTSLRDATPWGADPDDKSPYLFSVVFAAPN